MADLTSARMTYLKGALFVVGGLLGAAMVLLERPNWRVAVGLGVCVWCFCRAYYFAFYVIEHYIDPGYRFAGLGSFARYLWKRRKADTRRG